MRLVSLGVSGYRNLLADRISFVNGVNIILGDNAQGKTNLLEAIWLFTGNPSFRGGKWQELVAIGESVFSLNATFETLQRSQVATISFSLGETSTLAEKKKRSRKITLNDVPVASPSELYGVFTAVVFSPVHLSLIKDGPKNRRDFLDEAISQIKPSYEKYKKQYDRLLEQRNALLKTLTSSFGADSLLEVWNDQLAKIGVILSLFRYDYIKKLSPVLSEFYTGLSSGKEKISIEYCSTIFENEPTAFDDDTVKCYLNKLNEKTEEDIRTCSTSVGIHRDDVIIEIDGKSSRTYGSQGQQRSAVIALKLAEATLIKRITGELPIMLLDDVMSELDAGRQKYILSRLTNMQVFITCCDDIHIRAGSEVGVYEMSSGVLKKT